MRGVDDPDVVQGLEIGDGDILLLICGGDLLICCGDLG